MEAWPYPVVFVHRLGGALTPENTLAGLMLAHRLGARAVECDVKLSADNVPLLFHDDDLERICGSSGPVAHLTLSELRRLDAGSRHHPAFATEPIPLLDELAAAARSTALAVNLEIKPCAGRAAESGATVAQVAAAAWQGHLPAPLLSSFSEEALAAARDAVPHLPRALLLERWRDDWQAAALALGAVALHVHRLQLTPSRVEAAHAAGLRVMAWTVNDVLEARQLLAWGVDMLCTDRPDRLLCL